MSTNNQSNNTSSVEENQANRDERRAQGEFVRGLSTARAWVDEPETDRYHLIIAYNCPWCHRVALARAMLGLQQVISMDVLMPVRTEADHPQGEGKWQFKPEGVLARNGEFVQFEECTADTVTGKQTVKEIYEASQLEQTSVPILYDKLNHQVVNNESAEIVRMLATTFAPLGSRSGLELYPETLSEEVGRLNALIYPAINNGAYKAGFSSLQTVYQEAFELYFSTLDYLEELLGERAFLCGDTPTEADLRLFPTLFRHDPVYYLRMKLNKAYISEYPNLWRWLSDFYHLPGVSDASPLRHMTQGYFGRTGNGVLPLGQRGYLERLEDREFGSRQALGRRISEAVRDGRSPEELLAIAQGGVE